VNGVHDVGGMHGFGPVDWDEGPPSLDDWEAAVVAIQGATRRTGLINIDEFRHGIERMAPAHYLGSSYFEHWLDGIARVLVEKGAIDPAALDARTAFFAERPDGAARDALAAAPPATRPSVPHRGYVRPERAPPRFRAGDAVRARTTHPAGHTRLPRYARGRRGVIAAYHGVHVFPDTHAHGLGEQPQPLYSVRFEARELWGESAEPREAVYLDAWEPYLEPA